MRLLGTSCAVTGPVRKQVCELSRSECWKVLLLENQSAAKVLNYACRGAFFDTQSPGARNFTATSGMARAAQAPLSLALLPDDVCHVIFGLLNGVDLPVCARCA